MRKIIFTFIACIAICCTTNAQTKTLNKQETLDYINELFPKAIRDSFFAVKMSVVYADLERTPNKNSKIKYRYNLIKVKEVHLSATTSSEGETSYDLCFLLKDESAYDVIISHIVKDDDAKRLKKAFEHLVDLVKKDGDPFGN